MGEMIFIKNGLATTIGVDGQMDVVPADQCDICGKWDVSGAFTRDHTGLALIWACLDCRQK